MVEVSVDQLQAAIQGLHGLSSILDRVEQVHEVFKGKTVWEGPVHVFKVKHPQTDTCYAWTESVKDSKRRRLFTVLSIPPINSALDAVRASIMSDYKQS
jgi:hypothetical protein